MMFVTYGWQVGNHNSVLDPEGFDAAAERWKEFDRVRSRAFAGKDQRTVRKLVMKEEQLNWELKRFEEFTGPEWKRLHDKRCRCE